MKLHDGVNPDRGLIDGGVVGHTSMVLKINDVFY